MISRDEIASGLRRLGLREGDDVVVHSSLKSLGTVDGGAEAVVDALLDVLGIGGTLLAPTSVFSGSVTEFLRHTKEVDLRTAPSLLGKITEAVRLRSGALRSIHPSHPVAAIGARAAELLAGHHHGDTCCGALSPHGKLAERPNGKVLLLGVTTASMTLLHTAEEYFAPYIFGGETFSVRVNAAAGQCWDVTVRGYCVGQPRNFPALDAPLQAAGALCRGTVGSAVATLVSARGAINAAREQLSRNPNFLLQTEVGSVTFGQTAVNGHG